MAQAPSCSFKPVNEELSIGGQQSRRDQGDPIDGLGIAVSSARLILTSRAVLGG